MLSKVYLMRRIIFIWFFLGTMINSYGQFKSDSIEIRRKKLSITFLQYGKKLKPKQLLNITKSNEEAYKEMRIAKRNYTWGAAFGNVGAGAVGWTIGSTFGDGKPTWVLGGIGLGLYATSIPFMKAYYNHSIKAVEIYNSGLKENVITNTEKQPDSVALKPIKPEKLKPEIGRAINASIGYATTVPNDGQDYWGSGFYAQGEYVFIFSSWFSLRPYAGVMFNSPASNQTELLNSEYKVTSNAFLFGGKTRITAPIPYVAPFFELGIGGSIGSFENHTPLTNIKENGIIMYVPWAIGLAVGRKHNVDLKFTFYPQSSVDQFSGATAIGITFPLKHNKK